MAADLKEIKDEAATKPVLDYYKSYSQNEELTKFFSGVTCLTNIRNNDCELKKNDCELKKNNKCELKTNNDCQLENNESEMKTNNSCELRKNNECELKTKTNMKITISDPEEQSHEQSLDVSRASSTISNRKLEWDNGADIGYNNCQDMKVLQRSLSLPVFSNLDLNKFETHQKLSNTSKSCSSSGDNVKLIIFNSSPSSETKSSVLVPAENSCNSINSSSSDSSIDNKISNFSNTLSYLKRKIGLPDAHSTPQVAEELYTKSGVLDTYVDHKNKMPLSLDDQNIFIESGSNCSDKLIEFESSLNKNEDKKMSNLKTKVMTLCLTKPLIVECKYVPKQSDSKVHHFKQSSIGIQTEDVSEKEHIGITKTKQSLNQSFICYEQSETDTNTVGTIETNFDPNCNTCEYFTNFSVIDKKSGKSDIRTDYTDIQTHCPETQLFPENGTFVEEKSPIISDENEQSKRKLQKSSDSYLEPEVSSYEISDIRSELEKDMYLLQKLIKSKKYDSATKKRYLKKLIRKMSESNFLEVSSNNSELTFSEQSNLSTTHKINNQFPVNHGYYSSKVDRKEKGNVDPYNDYFSAKLNQNWKKDKTLSEKLFEKKQSSGDGCHSVNWANKEREYQICWINNEINHLGKLKNLLEEKTTTESIPNTSKKTTSVYKVSRKCSESSREHLQKYVIETELDVETSRQIEYNLNNEKFVVENLLGNLNKYKPPKHVLRDIKIVSSDNTININVSTICDTCKRLPCICKTDSLESLNNPTSNHSSSRKLDRTDLLSNSSETKTLSKIQNPCTNCKKRSCSCIPEMENNIFPEHIDDSPKKSTDCQRGALNEVFENCACNKQNYCDCQFVDQLLEHFDVWQSGTDEYMQAKQLACVCEHVATQTEVNTKNKAIEVCINQEHKLSQTENEIVHCHCHNPQRNKFKQHNFEQKIVSEGSNLLDGRERNGIGKTEKAKIVEDEMIENVNKNTIRDAVIQEYKRNDNYTNLFINNQAESRHTAIIHENRSLCHQNDKVNSQQSECAKCTNENKRFKCIKCNYDLKRSGNGSIPVNIKSKDISRATSPEAKSQTDAKMSSVGTCICGFNDKVYCHKECQQKCESLEDFKSKDMYSKTSATSTFPIDEPSVSTNADCSLKNICVSCEKEYSLENMAILTYRQQKCPYCFDCLQNHPILTCAYKRHLKEIHSVPRSESKSLIKDKIGEGVIGKHCMCTEPFRNNTDYCAYCQLKLSKTIKHKNGIAYFLTLEYENSVKYTSKKKKSKKMEEILLKIPCQYRKKKHKNQDNLTKKEADLHERHNYIQTENNDFQKKKTRMGLTLQEYLKMNRPDFINSAEYRRKTVEKYKQDRKSMRDQIKLRCLENNIQHNPRRLILFTEKEMKEITKRNCERLPEIISKLNHYRQQKLRNADKFIVDTFAKKIQFSVLNGKRTFPIGMNIISMQI